MNNSGPKDTNRKRLYNLKAYGPTVVRIIDEAISPGQLGYMFDEAEQCRAYFGIDDKCQANCAFYYVCMYRLQLHDKAMDHGHTTN